MSLISLFAARRSAPASRKHATLRLRLEALEDRTVPSGLDFMGPVAALGPPAAAGPVAPGHADAPGSLTGPGLAASSAAARPMKGQGTGSFTDAQGGFLATGTATHLGNFTH